MDANLTSIIDQTLVNSSAKRYLQDVVVTKYMSPDSSISAGRWVISDCHNTRKKNQIVVDQSL
jgi:hypothetical protein